MRSAVRQFALAILVLLSWSTPYPAWAGCPDCQDEQCVPITGPCVCVPKIGCTIPIHIPGTTRKDDPIPVPLPPVIEKEVQKAGKDVAKTVEKIGNETLITITKANKDVLQTLEKAGGDTITTLQKAADDSVTTVTKAANDTAATYVKAWKDTAEQTKKSLDDAAEAGRAVEHYVVNQANAQVDAAKAAAKRVKEGKVIDAMWGIAVEPAQATEKNFAKATQESAVLNAAAQSAAAAYGGPAGAAAYASWSTYRATGDANLELFAGVLSALTSQLGSSTANMPSGSAGELLKKTAIAGASGGIAVAAAGGDEKAITEGFLKSAGTVLIQGGSDKLKAYSPQTKNAFEAVHCISAKDVDCLSNTTYARDLKGKVLYDANGKPRIDPKKLDPNTYIGKWTGVDPNSPEGKKLAIVTQISKLPKSQTIPILKNQFVMTWTLGNAQSLAHNKPAIVLTYVTPKPPFVSKVSYGKASSGSTSISGSNSASYVCPFNGFNRTVRASATANGCDAVYRKEGGVSQVVWHSDHKHEICAAKAHDFATYLGGLGIKCRRQ